MNSGPTVQQGSSGSDVRRVQRILVMIKLFGFEEIDGIFGPKTKGAVKSFQESKGLVEDGIVGPATWGAMPKDPNTPQVSNGDTGPVVNGLQQGLHTIASGGSGPDPGPIDGIFGPKTEVAVRAYQTDQGVASDGIVGDRTWWVPAGAAGATLASLSGLTTV
ncbi:MAG TPA: peptidoglycan-binding protein [Thermoleophilaceae bacterium]|nr:peptidoglycan-binding protein [Thermoleophilaceae bacterium]